MAAAPRRELDHPAVAESLGGLAELRAGQGGRAGAERLYLRALGIWESHPKHPLTRGIPAAYAAFLRSSSRAAEADALAARAAGQ